MNLKVALIQSKHSENKEENIGKSIDLIKEASEQKAKLICLSELHCSRYFCQNEDTSQFALAEELNSQNIQKFQELSKELQIVLVISIFEKRRAGQYYNTALVIEKDGSIAGKYRKMHIPDDPDYYEKYYFTPGDLGFKAIQTSVGKLGILICWDQWFPEAARLMALDNADLLIYPTAIGWCPSDTQEEKEKQLDSWITIQCAHSIANGLPVLSINRTGFEGNPKSNNTNKGIDFWGNSFITDSRGHILHKAGSSEEKILFAEIDLTETERTRQAWPFLRDRRVENYPGLLEK